MAQKKTTTSNTKRQAGNRSGSKSTGSRTSAKSTTRRSTGSARTSASEPEQKNNVSDEIWLIVCLAFTVLLILSNFNLAGAFGRVLGGFLFGLFGVMAYVLPYVFFFMVAFGVANRSDRRAWSKNINLCVIFFLLTGLCSLISKLSGEKMTDYYQLSADSHRGGGYIGALIGQGLKAVVGNIGAYLILIALLLICFTLLTGKKILSWLRERSEEAVQDLSETQKAKREYAAEERAVRRTQKREERRARQESELNEKRQRLYTYTIEDPEPAVSAEEKKHEEVIKEYPKRNKKGLEGILPAGMLAFADAKPEETSPENEDVRREQTEIRIQNHNRPDPADAKLPDEDFFPEEEEEAIFPQPKPVAAPAKKEPEPKEPRAKEAPLSFTREANGPAYEQKLPEETPTPVLREAVEIPKEHRESKKDEILDLTKSIDQTIEEQPKIEYRFPPINLLSRPKANAGGVSDRELEETARKLQSTLDSFGVKVTVTNVSCGPSVTRYELQPEVGVKISRITALSDDIKMNLQATDIRIEAPIPGKAAVGIEVPNKTNSVVMLRTLLESPEFINAKSPISFGVGQDIGGQVIIGDIAKMPHLLIAGATGSGKSVCINTIIMSILYKAHPDDVKFIMVDPKMVELSVYNGIPHLLIPVVTDAKKASAALNWAVLEMTKRYQQFAELGVRDFKGYNKKWEAMKPEERGDYKHMPQIVIVVDELADLMMVAPSEVEDAICRLAQMARAAGMHLILATQRPSVNVITGLIKANVPSRIAFAVSSAIDSRTILDGSGAEKLLGKGDMLYFPSGFPKPVRIQGAFVSDEEVQKVVDYVAKQKGQPTYSKDIAAQIEHGVPSVAETNAAAAKEGEPDDGRDEYFAEAGRFIIEKQKASIGNLQRVYRIGFNRAARIMDQLSDAGVVGPEEGTKPRKVLMTKEEFEAYLNGGTTGGEE